MHLRQSGVRPQFILVALLRLCVIFWPQIQSIFEKCASMISSNSPYVGLASDARAVGRNFPHVYDWPIVHSAGGVQRVVRFRITARAGTSYRMTVTRYDQLSPLSNLALTVSLLPVPAVAVRRFRSSPSIGALPGDLPRQCLAAFTIAPLTVGRAGHPFPLPAYAQGRAHEHMAVVDISLALGLLLVVLGSHMAGLGWHFVAISDSCLRLAALPSLLIVPNCGNRVCVGYVVPDSSRCCCYALRHRADVVVPAGRDDVQLHQ